MRSATFFLCGCVCGVIATVFAVSSLQNAHPAPPVLEAAKSITVSLYPWKGHVAANTEAVHIPVENQAEIFRRLVPEKYYGRVHDIICPLVAEATITHANNQQTHVLVRDAGHNPAIVSVDGANYFYAKNEAGVYAGANELVDIVAVIAYKQKALQNSK